MSRKVDLGFIEDGCELWLLKNKFFPSKIGGKPAWLDLQNIPNAKDLLCDLCSAPCIFLCQIYAPLEENQSAKCFHRTVFVFVCKNASCYQPNDASNIKVFRSQLERRNEFYPYDPPNEDEPSDEIKSPVSLCSVCGCRGPSACAKCKQVNYCGVVHQRIDWKSGHKAACGTESDGSNSTPQDVLFPEYEIIIEAEEFEAPKTTSEAEELKAYEDLVKKGKTGVLSEIPENELDQYSQQKEDVHFEKFKKRNKLYPDQVLRYERDGTPLWIASNVPESIPDCELCGGKRIYEFQIMPQMLNSLKDENIDWGILAVYTCENSCDVDKKYAKEFVFKQDIVNTEC